MYEESIPEACPLQACTAALTELDCVAGADILPAEQDPSDYATLEVTIDPAALDDRGRMPDALAATVYDDDAPWDCGVVDVSRRMVDIQTVLVR